MNVKVNALTFNIRSSWVAKLWNFQNYWSIELYGMYRSHPHFLINKINSPGLYCWTLLCGFVDHKLYTVYDCQYTMNNLFSKRGFFSGKIWTNGYIQLLAITLFCTGSQWNSVPKKTNNSFLWIPNLIDVLYKMVEWQVIKCKQIYFLEKCLFLKIRSHMLNDGLWIYHDFQLFLKC